MLVQITFSEQSNWRKQNWPTTGESNAKLRNFLFLCKLEGNSKAQKKNFVEFPVISTSFRRISILLHRLKTNSELQQENFVNFVWFHENSFSFVEFPDVASNYAWNLMKFKTKISFFLQIGDKNWVAIEKALEISFDFIKFLIIL